MAQTTPAVNIVQPPINSIPAHMLSRFDPSYVKLYNEHNVGRLHTHQVPIEDYRANPSHYIISYGRQDVAPMHLRITEQSCPVAGGTIQVRICEPAPAGEPGQAPRPMYMNFHGGGWVFGDLETGFNFCKRMAIELDCVTVDVAYRLAPEHRFPVSVDDSWASFQWIRNEKQKELNIDVSRLAVGGCSAGGHIAAIIAHMCRDAGIPLAFQLLAVPVTDLHVFTSTGDVSPDCPYDSYREMADTVPLSAARMSWFHSHFLGNPRPAALSDPSNWKVSPIRHPNFAGLAPAMIVTAEMDVLRDEGEAYGAKMNAAGSKAEVIRIPGAPHSFSTIDEGLEIGRQYNRHALRGLGGAFNVTAKSVR